MKPVYLCGAAFRRYVITSSACLELCGNSWPLCIVCTWCSLSIVWTYRLLPLCIGRHVGSGSRCCATLKRIPAELLVTCSSAILHTAQGIALSRLVAFLTWQLQNGARTLVLHPAHHNRCRHPAHDNRCHHPAHDNRCHHPAACLR